MSDSELLSGLYAFTLERRMELSMNALAIFEFITTFGQEILSVWKRKFSGASLLLFAVRYNLLCTAITSMFQLGGLNLKECTGAGIPIGILLALGGVQTAAFSALRVYALCGGSMTLSAAVFLLQLSPVAVNAYGYIDSVFSVDPIFGCGVIYKYDFKTREILIYASRIPLTIGDALVVAITWMKSFQQLRIQRSMGVQFSLSTLLFRDGTAYFLLLLTLNTLEMSPLTASKGGFIIGSLTSNLPPILINRFMLNLRQLSDSEARSAGRIRTISTPMFQVSLDVAGNMGEPLDHGWEAREDHEPEVESEEVPQDDEEARHGDELEIGEVPRNPEEVRREDKLEIEEVPRNANEAGPSGHQSV